MEISELTIQPLRTAFPHEAYHLTTWLEQNLPALAKRLGLDLTDAQREVKVGDFCVDLLCADEHGNKVIVENQLERTDHDHLGKLLVYMVNLDAKTAIWISSDPRAEHLKVVGWLNEITPADFSFYLVKVEAVRIGDSPYAPLFSVMVRPDIQIKQIGIEKKEMAERHHLRLRFWTGLLETCKQRRNRFATRTPSTDSYKSVGSGLSGVTFNFVLRNDLVKVELYIDYDKESGRDNKRLFDLIAERKTDIEQAFGAPLIWDRAEDIRASKIWMTVTQQGLSDEDNWPQIQAQMIETMEKFDSVLRPEVERAKKALRLTDGFQAEVEVV